MRDRVKKEKRNKEKKKKHEKKQRKKEREIKITDKGGKESKRRDGMHLFPHPALSPSRSFSLATVREQNHLLLRFMKPRYSVVPFFPPTQVKGKTAE